MCGDASSKLVLQKAEPKATTVVFITTSDDDLNRECARIIKDEFHVEEIVSILRDPSQPGSLSQNEVLDTKKIIAQHMSNQVAATFKGIGIGLGQGEIRQITVMSSSAAIGMTLRELNPQKWLVAAIYRDQQLIVPHGDSTLMAKDRVLLVGNPEVLDAEVLFIKGGRILFPTQFGQQVAHVDLHGPEKSELNWVIDNTLASNGIELDSKALSRNLSHTQHEKNIGCMVVPPKSIPWYARLGITGSSQNKILMHSKVPVLIPRGSSPYKKILIAVHMHEHASSLVTVGVDLCRQFEGKLTSLTVITPHSDEQDATELEKLPKQITQFARSNGVEVENIVDKGNPIHKIREHAEHYDLLILGYSRKSRNKLFKPDISMHLLHNTPCSTLFVPWDATRR